MKNIITVFFIVLALPIFAQNDLEGTWYGIVVSDGSIKTIEQIWRFKDVSLEIEQVHDKYNDAENLRKIRSFDYEYFDDKLILKREDLDYVISIKQHTKQKLILNDTNQGLIFFLQKQGIVPRDTLKIEGISKLKYFKIETSNNEFDKFQLSFLYINKDGIILTLYENYKYLKSYYLSRQIMDLRNYDIHDVYTTISYEADLLLSTSTIHSDLKSIIVEKINNKEISGWINGNIKYKLKEIRKEPVYTKEDFKNRLFVGDFNPEKTVVSSKNSNRKSINIGKNKINFLTDSTFIAALYEKDYSNIENEVEEIPIKLFTYKGKWNLDDLGLNLYIDCYNEDKHRDKELRFQILRNEDDELVLSEFH